MEIMDILKKKIDTVFLPGDTILPISCLSSTEGFLKFGPGLRQEGQDVVAFKAGILRMKKKPLFIWIDTNQKRYVAVKGDTVIGIITTRGADSYKVDIGSSQPAYLNNLLFEGATKRNKPNLKINDLVFAKLIVANKDMEPEISCIDENNKSNNLGPLNDGYMFTVSLGLSRKLLQLPMCKVLSLLGKNFPFEIVVGLNGRIWIHSKGIIDTIAIANAIVSSEFMDDNEVTLMVKQLIESIAGFEED
ncbi:exosome complex component RRP40 [Hydra vulgaris]|uniref:Exosome complex component RRP40 n=1 Tax=Hydra vulgaris TaxID=6087 RepID=T2M4E6_HYDVU|nr:exosome complex component RRP40 [Hydra vulgaris]